MSAVYSGDITWRYTVAAAYGIQYNRAIKISREGVPTRSRPCSFNVDARVPCPARIHVPVHLRGCTYTHVQTHTHTRANTRTLARPAGNYRESRSVDLRHQSWSSDAIPWSMACLFSAYTLRRNQVLSTEMKNASGKSQLLYNTSSATDVSIVPRHVGVNSSYEISLINR